MMLICLYYRAIPSQRIASARWEFRTAGLLKSPPRKNLAYHSSSRETNYYVNHGGNFEIRPSKYGTTTDTCISSQSTIFYYYICSLHHARLLMQLLKQCTTISHIFKLASKLQGRNSNSHTSSYYTMIP